MKRYFRVGKPISLGYGSNTRCPTPTFHKEMQVGTVLELDCEAPNGNVWFIDPEGKRGVIQSGEVRNLILDGRVAEVKK